MSVSTDPMTEAKGQPDASVMGRYQHILRHRLLMMGVLALAILGSLLLDFTMGPSGLSLSSLWQTLLDPAAADAGTRVIVWDIRLPYALMAVVVGFALGLAGAEMQTILNNPLASPFTLGVSSAAAFGAALAIVLGIGIPGIPDQWFISANAFIFALFAALKAGAYCAHVSVNCLGERAGNVDLAEVAVTLELLYGVKMGIKLNKLAETAQLLEKLSGYAISLTKPVVGQRIFTRESGGVVQQLVQSPPSVEPYDPSVVGLERAIVLAYHGVGRPTRDNDPERLLVDPEHLEDHIGFLKRRGYRFQTMADALRSGNGNGLPDLYVASGGYHLSPASGLLQDRLYLNQGDGRFLKDPRALPEMRTATAAVAAGDFTGDGLPDLFVGGRLTPRNWPHPARGWLLRNDGGRFTDITLLAGVCCSEDGRPQSGMGVDAADYDNGGWQDLIVTNLSNEPNELYRNLDGKGPFAIVSYPAGLAEPSLLTYDPTNDRKGGEILEQKTVPAAPGSSGIQLRVKCNMLLEGYRPRRIVLVQPATWIYRALPLEEQLFGRE